MLETDNTSPFTRASSVTHNPLNPIMVLLVFKLCCTYEFVVNAFDLIITCARLNLKTSDFRLVAVGLTFGTMKPKTCLLR